VQCVHESFVCQQQHHGRAVARTVNALVGLRVGQCEKGRNANDMDGFGNREHGNIGAVRAERNRQGIQHSSGSAKRCAGNRVLVAGGDRVKANKGIDRKE